jgi:DNA-binding response OmpR family regulator
MSFRILIVDDEKNVRLMYRSSLESEGCEIFEADCGARALEECVARKHDAAILDLRMPGMDGLELLEKMKALNIETPAVIITAFGDVPNAVNAMKLGATDFLPKPLTPDQLRNVVKDILVRHSSEDKNNESHDFDYYLRCAKRAINLCDFAAAKRNLIKSLELNPESPQAMNLSGVMFEMREDFDQAKRYYGQAIKVDKKCEPAQQNMRRMLAALQLRLKRRAIQSRK